MKKVLLLIGAIFGVGCAAYFPQRLGERVHPNVRFSSPQGHGLHMDLYVPRSAKPVPVVVWIFGGSWRFGSKGFHVNVRDLTRHGIAVASIQYRLSDKAVYPAQLEDCRSAVQWLRDNSSRYGLDPQRIGVSGESAGGHLAALLGTIEGSPKIRAVFAMYPPTDLVELSGESESSDEPSDIEKLLGGPIQQKLALAAEASPVTHVSATSPPSLIIHGARDELVSIAQSEKLIRRLSRARVEANLIVLPEQDHWFSLNSDQVATVADFFHRHFYP